MAESPEPITAAELIRFEARIAARVATHRRGGGLGLHSTNERHVLALCAEVRRMRTEIEELAEETDLLGRYVPRRIIVAEMRHILRGSQAVPDTPCPGGAEHGNSHRA